MKKVFISIFAVIALSIQMMSLTVNAEPTVVISIDEAHLSDAISAKFISAHVSNIKEDFAEPFESADGRFKFNITSKFDEAFILSDYSLISVPVNVELVSTHEAGTFGYVLNDKSDAWVTDGTFPYTAAQSDFSFQILFLDLTNAGEVLITFEADLTQTTPPPVGPITPTPKPEEPVVKPPVTNPTTPSTQSSGSNGNAWGTVAQSGGSTTTKTTETTATTPSTTPTAPSAPTPTVTTKSFINGFENGTVRPNDLITRAQLAQIVYSLYYKSGDVSGVNYSEVSSSHWAYNAISFVSAQGYMTGYPDGTFKPDAPITRAEIATVISRLKNLQNSQQATFTDVSGHWATEHINKLVAAGFISGYPDNTFKPNDNATRAEAVSIISKAEGRSGKYTGSKSFSDLPATHWAYDVMMNATNGN